MPLPECAALECERLKARLKFTERACGKMRARRVARARQDGSDGEGWALPWGAPVSGGLLLRHAAITQA